MTNDQSPLKDLMTNDQNVAPVHRFSDPGLRQLGLDLPFVMRHSCFATLALPIPEVL
jgi:hypothetical protein